MGEFDLIIAVVSLVSGVLLVSGHGGILMKGGDVAAREKMYNVKKMEKASGIVFLAVGVLTLADSYLDYAAVHLAYVAVLLILFAGLFIYIRKYCRK